MRTILIDADMLVYEAALANEVEIQWDEDLWTLHAHFEPAREQIDDTVKHLLKNLDAKTVVMALSDYTDPWRKKVMPTYKLARGQKRKPITFNLLRQHIHDTYQTFQRPSLEGDDVLGILLTNPVLVKGEKVLVSEDKDMNTLPGLHCKLREAMKTTGGFAAIRRVTQGDADFNHMKQALMGDATDGYGGCPGIGPKTADKLLLDHELWGATAGDFDVALAWPVIVAAYVKAGLNEEVALMNARVARILRHGDYDYTKKEVRLWEPPKSSPVAEASVTSPSCVS